MKYGMWLDEWFRNYIQPSSKIKIFRLMIFRILILLFLLRIWTASQVMING